MAEEYSITMQFDTDNEYQISVVLGEGMTASEVQSLLDNYEEYLGLPDGDNYILSSTSQGVRSWEDPSSVLPSSQKNRLEVASITVRDNLSEGEDFEKGDIITVTDNGYGERIKCQYLYDADSQGYKWIEIGVLSQFNSQYE